MALALTCWSLRREYLNQSEILGVSFRSKNSPRSVQQLWPRCGLALIGYVVGQKAAAVGIDFKAAFEGRDRALVAVLPLADPAGDADRLKAAFQIEAVGIDEAGSVADLTAEANGVAADGGEEGPAGF